MATKQKVTFFDDTLFELNQSTYNDGASGTQGQLSSAGIYFTPAETNPENTDSPHHIAHNGHIYTLGPTVNSKSSGSIECTSPGDSITNIPNSLNTLTANNNIYVVTKVDTDRFKKQLTYTLERLDLSGIVTTINALASNIVSLQNKIDNITGNVTNLTSFTLTLAKKNNKNNNLITTSKYVIGETAYLGHTNEEPSSATIGGFVDVSTSSISNATVNTVNEVTYIVFNSTATNGSVTAYLTTGVNLAEKCSSTISNVSVSNIPITLSFSYSISNMNYTISGLSLQNKISVLGGNKQKIINYIENNNSTIKNYYNITDVKTSFVSIDSSTIKDELIATRVYNSNSALTYLPLSVDMVIKNYKLTLAYNSNTAYINILNETQTGSLDQTLATLINNSAEWYDAKSIIPVIQSSLSNSSYTVTFKYNSNTFTENSTVNNIIKTTSTKTYNIPQITVTISKEEEPVDRNIYTNFTGSGSSTVLTEPFCENSYLKVLPPDFDMSTVNNMGDEDWNKFQNSYVIKTNDIENLFFYIPVATYINGLTSKISEYRSPEYIEENNVYILTSTGYKGLYIKALQ